MWSIVSILKIPFLGYDDIRDDPQGPHKDNQGFYQSSLELVLVFRISLIQD